MKSVANYRTPGAAAGNAAAAAAGWAAECFSSSMAYQYSQSWLKWSVVLEALVVSSCCAFSVLWGAKGVEVEVAKSKQLQMQ